MGSLSKPFNYDKEDQRLTKGSLYTKRQWSDTEQILSVEGFKHQFDNTESGFSVYHQFNEAGELRGEISVFLDELGCDPKYSGGMIVVRKKGDESESKMSSVWNYPKQRRKAWREARKAQYPNPVNRLFHQVFG